ncbi:hypothetical protein BJ742DRAFT_381265 [Cladochytrium replicatum]|nr:hypothetical protein BJ742DRAFT_381265 [Cladochytrium replicatum]
MKVDGQIEYSSDQQKLTIPVSGPTAGDYLFCIGLIVSGGTLIYFTTGIFRGGDWIMPALAFAGFLLLAHQYIDDTYVTIMDLQKNEVRVVRSKFGRIQAIRAAALDELVDVEVVEQKEKKKVGYRLEYVFQSAHGAIGAYRIPATESFAVGPKAKGLLDILEREILKFAEVKKPPNFQDKLDRLNERFAKKREARAAKKLN